ncbi:MAG: hypothetical protein HY898_18685 [Deltaproteobacteria bacterium]|nr:hypothetical protein [Deltaproteobacteria bacterium]
MKPSPIASLLAVLVLATTGCDRSAARSAPPPETVASQTPSTGAHPQPSNALPPAPALDRVPQIGGCAIFPPDSPWNRDISREPVDSRSAIYIAAINEGGDHNLHADFGSNPEYGFPYVIVPPSQPPVPISYHKDGYPSESDPGPMPIPANAPVEFGSDHHVLVVQSGTCLLFELYHAARAGGSGWACDASARFDLRSNALRPRGWTSCDQAGLPILPGLVRYDEVAAGEIRHALRFTVWRPQKAWVAPATHYGEADDPRYPPMGARLRLRSSFDQSRFHGQARVVLQALSRYGMLVADTGTSWFISGAKDSRWNDEDLDQLKTVPGTAFEVVETGAVQRL